MDTAVPPLTDAEKLEFGERNNHQVIDPNPNRLIIASYNIRYARGPYLISGGVRRKLGLMNLRGRPQHVAQLISDAASAFTNGKLLPPVDILALQEADKRTVRTGGHHVAEELACTVGHELGARARRNPTRYQTREAAVVARLRRADRPA